MKLIRNPMVKLDSVDAAALQGFENFINRFDDDYCTQIRCDDCLYLKQCQRIFGEDTSDRPYVVMKKMLEFFKDIPVEEG